MDLLTVDNLLHTTNRKRRTKSSPEIKIGDRSTHIRKSSKVYPLKF